MLISADGKELVQARYAVRNNQRNFVKITLPTGATVWSASLAGKPVRPGQSRMAACCCLWKNREAARMRPRSRLRFFIWSRRRPGRTKGARRVTLPALDLPISRTGMLLYYPPSFQIDRGAGNISTRRNIRVRFLPYCFPQSKAEARRRSLRDVGDRARKNVDRLEQFANLQAHGRERKERRTRRLCSTRSGRNRQAGKVTGILPVNVSFPAFGPSMFLVSELTSENQFPAAEFNFQRDKKGGVR